MTINKMNLLIWMPVALSSVSQAESMKISRAEVDQAMSQLHGKIRHLANLTKLKTGETLTTESGAMITGPADPKSTNDLDLYK